MKTDRRNFLGAMVGTTALLVLDKSASAEGKGLPAKASPVNLASDPLRPQYHFLPAANWMNDPNGPIYWNGKYHMFYQYNPDGAYWGNMHWGHAISSDMVHWSHLPVALAPTKDGPDADGCFTGTAFVQGDQVALLYTGVRVPTAEESLADDTSFQDHPPGLRERQCLAIASDRDLKTWTKSAAPVIASPPLGLDVNGFRDPSPWKQGEWWYTVLGSGLANQGGAVLLYRSKDLHNWEYLHILSGRSQSFDPLPLSEVWECPEFFALGDWHVLIYSTDGHVYWQSGKLNEKTMTFHPEQCGIVDYGCFYAAKSQLDATGNRILWGWIQETRSEEEHKAAGWAGMMSLPRVLEMSGNGRLRLHVAPAVNALRKNEKHLQITGDEGQNLDRIKSVRVAGCCGEILCTTRRGNESYRMILHGLDWKGSPWLKITYDAKHPEQVKVNGHAIPLEVEKDEELHIHIYVDGSVMEVFLNDQIARTVRVYYKGAQDLCMEWQGSTTSLSSLTTWELAPISSNRLT